MLCDSDKIIAHCKHKKNKLYGLQETLSFTSQVWQHANFSSIKIDNLYVEN